MRKRGTLAAPLALAACLLAGVPMLALHTGHSNSHTASQSYLGIDISNVSESDIAALHLSSPRGAQITRVDHDGPAGKAGLQVKDIVLRINNQSIDNEEQCRKFLRETPAGRSITMQINRNGQIIDVTATLANRAEVEKQAWKDHFVVPQPSQEQHSPGIARSFIGNYITFSVPYTGLSLDEIGPQLADYFGVRDGKGLLVHTVDANSPAASVGMRAGDVVIRVNGKKIESTGDWNHILRDTRGQSVNVTIFRDKREQNLTLTPGGKKRSAIEAHSDITCAMLAPLL